MGDSWSDELWRLLGLALLGLILGLVLENVAWTLFVVLALYFAWHLRNLYQLNKWLQGKRTGMPGHVGGLWSDIYYHLYRLQQRNRKRKKRLASMLNRFRESTDALPDAAVILNDENVIESWNRAATSLLKLKAPQDIHKPITNLLRNPDFIQYLRDGDFEDRLLMPSPVDERIMLSLRIVPYGKKQRLLVVRDITRLHLLEQVRRDFIANVSHELRTPLTVVSGYLETLIDEDDEWVRKNRSLLLSMQQQTARMQNIVVDLLLLSRLETDTSHHVRNNVDVPAMLEMLREDAMVLSAGKHEISTEIDHSLWLRGNREELMSAFSNLVYNAVKYTPKGGSIRIRWYADESGAHLAVVDTGEGIPPQHIPRLTERFYRVDVGRSRDSGGTGLGLAIVKHVLNRHQGSLHIESELDKGSTFRCDFPSELIQQKEVA